MGSAQHPPTKQHPGPLGIRPQGPQGQIRPNSTPSPQVLSGTHSSSSSPQATAKQGELPGSRGPSSPFASHNARSPLPSGPITSSPFPPRGTPSGPANGVQYNDSKSHGRQSPMRSQGAPDAANSPSSSSGAVSPSPQPGEGQRPAEEHQSQPGTSQPARSDVGPSSSHGSSSKQPDEAERVGPSKLLM